MQTQDSDTIASLLFKSVNALRATSDSARLDAEVLLAHVLEKTRVQLYGDKNDKVRPDYAAKFLTLVSKRREGLPIAQLTGRREFWSLDLDVTPDTLIPRPETELLVECALNRIDRDAPGDILDLGTGSGAIALAVARERRAANVTATDLSEAALAVARQNANKLDLHNVRFRPGDWYGAVMGQHFGTIVANPPYVTEHEFQLHDFELIHEPLVALLGGGRDGLAAIRLIAGKVAEFLLPGGWLLVEHGFRQGSAVARLFQQAGLRSVCTYRDLPGLPRVTEGQLPE